MPPGEVLVATEVGDPSGGLLACPAAPLVGGTLRRKGIRVSYAPVPRCGDASPSGEGATLFITSALQRDGTATAIGAGANGVDSIALAAARGAVEEWSAVVGTRRLLGAVSPWCDGASQALDAARRAVAGRREVHVYGQLAGDPDTIAELAGQGAVFVASLEEVPDGATVLFPAHGVPAAVRAAAAARGLELIDATCPLVTWAHGEARKFAERGDDLVLIGQPGHAAVAGLTGQAPGKITLVSSPAGTATLRVADPRRVSYLLQPGIPLEESAPVTAALRSRFPAVHGPHPDGFCYAASDRAETIRAIASACDTMLVLGSAGSPDSRRIAGFARDGGTRAHVVSEVGDIVPSMLSGAAVIGLAPSTSARPALAGLGLLSVTNRRVTTEIVGAPGQS